MDDFYLHLHCADSLLSYVDNHAGYFTVNLPRRFLLSGQWECGFPDIPFVSDFEKLAHRICVCSNLVEDSYVKGTSLPVLCSIDVETEEKFDLILNPVFYFKLRREELSRLQIFIRDDTLGPSRLK
jgi:hypothetical protein